MFKMNKTVCSTCGSGMKKIAVCIFGDIWYQCINPDCLDVITCCHDYINGEV